MFLCLQIKDYEKLDSEEERLSRSRQIYDGYIMKELLSCSHVRHRPRRDTDGWSQDKSYRDLNIVASTRRLHMREQHSQIDLKLQQVQTDVSMLC